MKKALPLFLLAAASLFAFGCVSPIKTTVDYTATAEGVPQLKYSSEKDIEYERVVKKDDGVVESVKFKASASDPMSAYAGAITAQSQAIESLVNSAPAQTTARILTPAAPAP